MSQIVYKNKYYDVEYHDDSGIMRVIWKKELEYATEEDFKEHAIALKDLINTYKPKGYIQDTINAIFPITEEIQRWILNTLTPVMEKYGAKRNAILMSEDILTSMSLDMFVFQMNENSKIRRKIFSSYDEAYDWVKQSIDKNL